MESYYSTIDWIPGQKIINEYTSFQSMYDLLKEYEPGNTKYTHIVKCDNTGKVLMYMDILDAIHYSCLLYTSTICRSRN